MNHIRFAERNGEIAIRVSWRIVLQQEICIVQVHPVTPRKHNSRKRARRGDWKRIVPRLDPCRGLHVSLRTLMCHDRRSRRMEPRIPVRVVEMPVRIDQVPDRIGVDRRQRIRDSRPRYAQSRITSTFPSGPLNTAIFPPSRGARLCLAEGAAPRCSPSSPPS